MRIRQPEAQVGAGRKDGRAARDDGGNLAFAPSAPAPQKMEAPSPGFLADAAPEPEAGVAGGVEGASFGHVAGGVVAADSAEARPRAAEAGVAVPARTAGNTRTPRSGRRWPLPRSAINSVPGS